MNADIFLDDAHVGEYLVKLHLNRRIDDEDALFDVER